MTKNKCNKRIEKMIDKLEEDVYKQINSESGDFEKPFRKFKDKLKQFKC